MNINKKIVSTWLFKRYRDVPVLFTPSPFFVLVWKISFTVVIFNVMSRCFQQINKLNKYELTKNIDQSDCDWSTSGDR